MEPNARIKSGFFAFALGLTASFICAGGPEPVLAQNNNGQPHSAVTSNFAGQPAAVPQDANAVKNRLLLEARRALAYNDLNTAEKKLFELQSMNLQITEGDKPQLVNELIVQFKAIQQKYTSEGATESNKQAYAVLLTRQALGLLLYDDLETAEKLAKTAMNQGVTFDPEAVKRGFDPKSILVRIQDKRIAERPQTEVAVAQPMQQHSLAVQNQLVEAGKTLAQGRAAMNAGNFELAEKHCRAAIAFGIPDYQFPQGADTPGKLQADISRTRLAGAPANVIGNTNGGAVQANYNSNRDNAGAVRQVSMFGDDSFGNFDLETVQGEAAPLYAGDSGSFLNQASRQGLSAIEQLNAETARDFSAAYRVRENNPEEALNILYNTRARVENAELDPVQKQAQLRSVDFVIEQTRRYMETNRPRIEMQARNDEIQSELQERRENKSFLEQKLKEIMEQIAVCLDENRYEEAMHLANKANELAPNDPAVQLVYKSTKIQMNDAKYMQYKNAKEDGLVDGLLAVDRAAALPVGIDDNPMMFDIGRWDLISGRQSMSDLENDYRLPAEMEIIRKLSDPIRLDFEDEVPLEEVFSQIQAYTGIPIVADPNALREVEVSLDRMVRASLPREVSLRSALNLILRPMQLTYHVDDEVLKITTPSRAKSKLVTKRYYVGDLVVTMQNSRGNRPTVLETAHDKAMQQVNSRGQMGFNNGAPFSTMNTMNHPGADMRDPTVYGQLNPGVVGSGSPSFGNSGYAPYGASGGGGVDFESIIELITSVTGDEDAWENEQTEPREYFNNLSLVIRQTEDVHAEIADLLKQLRKLNDLQVTVEVRFITLSDSFFERMGVDFDLNFRNKNAASKTTFGTTGTTTGTGTNTDTNTVNDGDTVTAHGDKVVVGLSAPGVFNANLDVPMNNGSYEFGTPMFGGFDPNAGASLGFAILSDIEAYFFMNAAQGDTRSNVLQAPKVTIFNGLWGNIYDGSSTPFVTSATPVVGDFAAAYQPVVSIINEGTNLSVQAVVSADRKYVRVTLNPTFTTITNKNSTFRFSGEDSQSTEETSSTKGDASNPSASDEQGTNKNFSQVSSGVTIQQPVVAEVSVTTTVSVPDGGTVLLGGIKRLSEGRNEAGVPMLNKVPFISRLFMNTAIGRDTESLMLMVTPRILIQEEEEMFMRGTSPMN